METILKSEYNFWNSYARKYDKFIRRNAEGSYNQIIKEIKKTIPPDSEVLEIGTGTGNIAFAIAGNVRKITAIDSAPEMIRVAKEKQNENQIHNVEFSSGNIKHLRYKDKSWAFVIAANVLHLVEKPGEAMKEIRRILKDDGKAIVPTYCHGDGFLSQVVSRIMGMFGFIVVSRWSTRSFREFAENNGFSVVHEQKINGKIPLSYLCVEKTK
jgi:ubiquinone/menaquinone biosynthesis C-methylase UbiE